jgi:hypothetical protein
MPIDGPPNDLRPGGMTRGNVTGNHTTFNAIAATPWTPPDPSIAVGPDHVLVTVNMAVAWYDKSGNEQFSAYLDSTGNPGFFEELGCGNFTFDPKCFYDPIAERFVVLALEYYDDTDESWITFAVSDDSDPNGTWYKYRTWSVVSNLSSTYWVDYPGFGFDDDAYYVTGNLFNLTGPSGWGGVLYRVIEKSSLLSGGTATIHDVRKGNHASAQCAQHYGSSANAFFVSPQDQTRLRVSKSTTTPTPQCRQQVSMCLAGVLHRPVLPIQADRLARLMDVCSMCNGETTPCIHAMQSTGQPTIPSRGGTPLMCNHRKTRCYSKAETLTRPLAYITSSQPLASMPMVMLGL